MDWKKIKQDMVEFLRQGTHSRGFSRVVFGLSGGLDSAIVAYLCQEAFGKNALAVLMPSSKSSVNNFEDAKMLVEVLNLESRVISLKEYEKVFGQYEQMDRVRYGNLCARTRMMLLYDLAYQNKALVIGTSNKSERMLGYGTIYGDLACAINPIGDVFKSDLYEFARVLGVPQKIIDKQPSADLYEGQSDEGELGYSYYEIDKLLKEISQKKIDFSDCKSVFATINGEYCKEFLKNILERIYKNRFKLDLPEVFILT